MSSAYGRIVTGANVRHNVTATLQTFFPSYLAEIAEASGRTRDALPAPESWHMSDLVDNWAGEQLPALVVVSPGFLGSPTIQSKSLNAVFDIRVGFVVASHDRETTRELAELYAAAGRACMMQHQSLPYLSEGVLQRGISSGIDLLDESYDDAPTEDSRTLGAATVTLGVHVDGIVDIRSGLQEPDVDPDPLVDITATYIHTRKKPL
ncbi:hypothetical protein GTQ99_00225 [Kineococcus sp. T13]|uniref:hypothetical protein n=1 Tax=Kineococcus vitellinus TaxID=2696565 RepID=UPI0014128F1E|nr:hypothetical protein [Kineococcus vitellinus]NAZ73856.1 hypothetical protein [Kineococcus vitellinus]